MDMQESCAVSHAFLKYSQSKENPDPFGNDHRPRLMVFTSSKSQMYGMANVRAVADVVVEHAELPDARKDGAWQCYLLVTRTNDYFPKVVSLFWDTEERPAPTLVDYSTDPYEPVAVLDP